MQPQQLPNHAKFSLKDDQTEAEADILLQDRHIGMLHGQVDKPGAEFDVVILDNAGNEQARRHFKSTTERFGERLDLPLTDNYNKIKVENVRGAKSIDIFAE